MSFRILFPIIIWVTVLSYRTEDRREITTLIKNSCQFAWHTICLRSIIFIYWVFFDKQIMCGLMPPVTIIILICYIFYTVTWQFIYFTVSILKRIVIVTLADTGLAHCAHIHRVICYIIGWCRVTTCTKYLSKTCTRVNSKILIDRCFCAEDSICRSTCSCVVQRFKSISTIYFVKVPSTRVSFILTYITNILTFCVCKSRQVILPELDKLRPKWNRRWQNILAHRCPVIIFTIQLKYRCCTV